jgi:hypothetical protein
VGKALGRGLLQSLRARVDADVVELRRQNRSLRRTRYGFVRRFLRGWFVGQPAKGLITAYGLSLGTLFLIEWGLARFAPSLSARVINTDFTKDAAGFFLAAQVGILAVLTVAISVVTLLTQKDDGSAINTDVRLYYVESYAYELVTSGIFLSIVLVLNLFWPLKFITEFTAGEQLVDRFKFCVTMFNAIWLVLNFYLFSHFIHTTLKFVEPKSRARLRKQYSANESIPRDVKRRLLQAYYLHAPVQIFGLHEIKEGPLISFGMPLMRDQVPAVEVSRSFKVPSSLVDVWLLPLAFALRAWRLRNKNRFDTPSKLGGQEPHLAVLTDFARVHDDEANLVVREGGTPLTRFERALVKISLRFSAIDSREDSAPTPTDFLEQLIFRMVTQIEAGSPNGFDDALTETVDFHSFVLAAQNTRDEAGLVVNLAQVNDGLFLQPDFAWVREYRRAYAAATSKMASDGSFVQGMNRVAIRLWPQDP